MWMCDFAGHLLFCHILCGRGRDCMLSVREQGGGVGMAARVTCCRRVPERQRLLQVSVSSSGSWALP